jgi:hypothetical protein
VRRSDDLVSLSNQAPTCVTQQVERARPMASRSTGSSCCRVEPAGHSCRSLTTWENRRQYLVSAPVAVTRDGSRRALWHGEAPTYRYPSQRGLGRRGSVGCPDVKHDVRQCGRGIEIFDELERVVCGCAHRQEVRPAQSSDLRVCSPQQQPAPARVVETKRPAIDPDQRRRLSLRCTSYQKRLEVPSAQRRGV